MSLFQSILADIKKKLDTETLHIDSIARIASTVLGITVTPSQVVQKGSHIRFNLSPTARTALILKRPELLQAIQNEHSTITSIG